MNLKRSNEKREEYRRMYSDKESFLSLIQNFTSVSIAKELTLKNIELETSFICEYKGKEVGIIYKVFSKSGKVSHYIVLEFQTEMDTEIVPRLKSYREQIWKSFIMKKSLEEIEDKNFKLPKVIPVVLYSGPERLSRKKGILDIVESISEFSNNSSMKN
ncbi:Rpn family recombination-promoting nuclease/putative transposase [Clostridioides difficile]|nr:Rpn family recombination-promoting nuclease/putative transposase [Clostridioides difficile]